MIRVFPRKIPSTSPSDPLAFFGPPPKNIPSASSVAVSVTFTYDRHDGEVLARAWESTGLPVSIGGPAFGDRGGVFVPGRFLKSGYVITSRGCPNSCWFCDVPRREGGIRELPITGGWNVLDSNLLACSERHVDAVFQMLSRQKRRPEFTGGLEAKRITPDIAMKLRAIRTNRIYCAYDTPDDLEPLVEAGKLLRAVGFTRKHHLHCYVLHGFPRDTMQAAHERVRQTWRAGFMPMAMWWKGPQHEDWAGFQRCYSRPAIARAILEKECGSE